MRVPFAMFVACIAVSGGGLPAAAQTTQTTQATCTKVESARIDDAIRGAHDLALQASVLIGDTPEYRRWFGRYTPRAGDELRANFKSVYRALNEQTLTGLCGNSGEGACKGGIYAFVNRDRPWILNVCPPFFDLPTMTGVAPGTPELDNGTQEGTIIHEVSHFDETAGTDDLCYSRTECEAMARRDPNGARRNADSYQYFSEDVIFYVLQAKD